MKTIRFATALIASSFLAATAAAAQTAPAQPKAVATPSAQLAPDHLAAAQRVVAKLWPDATLRTTYDPLVDAIAHMKLVQDMGYASPGPEPEPVTPPTDASRHEDERKAIMFGLIKEQLWGEVAKRFPQIREMLAFGYARQFSRDQLADLDTFLVTPSGQVYAKNWTAAYDNPQVAQALDFLETYKLDPRAIRPKYEAAIAHIPQEPDSGVETAEDASDGKRDTWSAADRSAVERKEADVAGAEFRLADERGRLELMKYEARLRAGEKLSADDQQYLDSLRALFGKKK